MWHYSCKYFTVKPKTYWLSWSTCKFQIWWVVVHLYLLSLLQCLTQYVLVLMFVTVRLILIMCSIVFTKTFKFTFATKVQVSFWYSSIIMRLWDLQAGCQQQQISCKGEKFKKIFSAQDVCDTYKSHKTNKYLQIGPIFN